MANPKRAKWTYYVHAASQSALRNRFILPTGAASYVTRRIITWRPHTRNPKENHNESRSGKSRPARYSHGCFPTTRFKIENFKLELNKWGNDSRFSVNYEFLAQTHRKNIFTVKSWYQSSSSPFFCTQVRPFNLKGKFWNFQQLVSYDKMLIV